MLNPPLSLLSTELLAEIVDQIHDRWGPGELHTLALADRAFTPLCQAHIFHTLICGVGGRNAAVKLNSIHDALRSNPSTRNWVKRILVEPDLEEGDDDDIDIRRARLAPPFSSPTLLEILKEVSSSQQPPQSLTLYGRPAKDLLFKTPEVTLAVINRTLASSLTTLALYHCSNVPLSIFLMLPHLQEVALNESAPDGDIQPSTTSENQHSPPLISILDYQYASSLVSHMIGRKPEGGQCYVDCSRLKTLRLAHSEKSLRPVQWILDQAQETLERLLFTNLGNITGEPYIPLGPLLNLRHLHSLKLFALCTTLHCEDDTSHTAIDDICEVLSTISQTSAISQLKFSLDIFTYYPYDELHSQNWRRFADEIARISGGKPLRVEIEISLTDPDFFYLAKQGFDDLLAFLHKEFIDRCRAPEISMDFEMQ